MKTNTYENWDAKSKYKNPYNLFFSPKNTMYGILGTLFSSLASTNMVKTREV
jgi:hypothetical protein